MQSSEWGCADGRILGLESSPGFQPPFIIPGDSGVIARRDRTFQLISKSVRRKKLNVVDGLGIGAASGGQRVTGQNLHSTEGFVSQHDIRDRLGADVARFPVAYSIAGAEQSASVGLASTYSVAESQMPIVIVVHLDDEIEVARTALQQIALHGPGLEQSLEIGDQRCD